MHNIFSMGPQGLFWSLSNANAWAPVRNDLDERSREKSGDVDQNKTAGFIEEAARKWTQTHLTYKTKLYTKQGLLLRVDNTITVKRFVQFEEIMYFGCNMDVSFGLLGC